MCDLRSKRSKRLAEARRKHRQQQQRRRDKRLMPTPPIIIIKKKGAHGGHHGGAWKVAYADFVTAMMALFIVLWLLNTSEKVQKEVAGYFKDPAGVAKLAGSPMEGVEENFVITKDNMEELKEQLQ